MNPAEFIVVGNIDYVKFLQKRMDDIYKICLRMFDEWKGAYAMVLDTSMETDLQIRMNTLKTNLLAYKRLALDMQANLPALEPAPFPQPASSGGKCDHLARYLKNEAKGKMLAMYNKLKNNTDRIR